MTMKDGETQKPLTIDETLERVETQAHLTYGTFRALEMLLDTLKSADIDLQVVQMHAENIRKAADAITTRIRDRRNLRRENAAAVQRLG